MKSDFYRQLILNSKQVTPNQNNYDVRYYSLDLIPDPQTAHLSGETEIIIRITSPSLEQVELNFWDGMTIQDIFFTSSPESKLTYTLNDDILAVDLDSTLVQDEQASITIRYSGYPENSGYGSFGFEIYNGKDFIGTFNQPIGARGWFPCKDFPFDKADSIDIRVTVRNDLIVASNGVLKSKITNGPLTTYWWHHGYPIVTYLVSLAIYPYFVWSDTYISVQGQEMPIEFYTFADTNSASPSYLVPNYKKTRSMIEFFASIFGEYPFIDEKYGHAEWTLSFGMEHQTITSMGNPTERRVAHELAHMWWGDMITCRTFHHIWLNEGFARYAESLWFAYTGFSPSASAYQMEYHTHKGEGTIYVEDPVNDDIFDIELSYNKASWVLHMLRHVVGDSIFFNILKTYHVSPDHHHNTANTEDFQRICEQVSGLKLEKFFQQWIYGEYFPSYSYGWVYEPTEDGYKVKVEIKQLQTNTGIFWMPIDVSIKTEKGTSVSVAWDSLKTQSFEFFSKDRPLEIELDADDWILKDVTTHLMSPYTEKVFFNNPYQLPGSGILRTFCETYNPDGHHLELSAFVESLDKSIIDSIQFSDNGVDDDGIADNGIFGGSWQVPPGELYYKMDMLTHSVDSSYVNYQSNKAYFTTVGPVILTDYITASGDSFTTPGADFLIKFDLQNMSETVTIPNITAELVSSDTCIREILHDKVNYGTLAPGESEQTEGVYALRINPNCPSPHLTTVDVVIKSNGNIFWRDKLQFDIISDIQGVDQNIPEQFALNQNYPNPFNPLTTINYQLPISDFVDLSIYNLLGQKVRTLVSEKQNAGYHKINWNANGFASGVYYYQMRTDAGFVQTKKLLLLR